MPLRQRLNVRKQALSVRPDLGVTQQKLKEDQIAQMGQGNANSEAILGNLEQGIQSFKDRQSRIDDHNVQSNIDDSKRRLSSVGAGDEAEEISEEPVDDRNGLEKALNLTPNQNFVFDMFEIIERPMKAIASGIQGVREEGNPLSYFSEGIKGLTGENKTTWSEALGINEDTPEWAKFSVNLVGDILLDPLTYITFGTSAAVKQGAVQGTKATSKVGKELLQEGAETIAKKGAKELAKEGAEQTVKKTFPIGFRVGNFNVGSKGKALDQHIFGLAGKGIGKATKGAGKGFVSILDILPGSNKLGTKISNKVEEMATSMQRVKSQMGSLVGRTGTNKDAAVGQRTGQDFDRLASADKMAKDGMQEIAMDFKQLSDNIILESRKTNSNLAQATMTWSENGKSITKTIKDMSEEEVLKAVTKSTYESMIKGRDIFRGSTDLISDVTSKRGLLLTTENYKSEEAYKKLKSMMGDKADSVIKVTPNKSGEGFTMTLTDEGKKLLKDSQSAYNKSAKALEELPTRQQTGKDLKKSLKKNKEALERAKKEGASKTQINKLEAKQKTLERKIKSNNKRIDDLKAIKKDMNKSQNFLHREGTSVKVNQFEKNNLTLNLELAAKNGEFKNPEKVIAQADEIADEAIKTGKDGEYVAQFVDEDVPKSTFFSPEEVELGKQAQNIKQSIINLQTRGADQIDSIIRELNIGADLSKFKESKNYLKRVVNPDELDYYAKSSWKKGASSEFNYIDGMRTPENMVIKRKWLGASDDINRALGKQLFLDDPLLSVGMNMQLLPKQFRVSGLLKNGLDSGVIKVMDVGQNFNDIKKLKGNHHMIELPNSMELVKSLDFLKATTKNKKNLKVLDKQINQVLEGGKVAIDRRLYKEVKSYNKLLDPNSGDLKEFLGTYIRPATAKWKKLAMANPAIHVRNFYSNNERMFLSGMNLRDVIKHKMGSWRQQKIFNKELPKHYDAIVKEMSSLKGAKWKNPSLKVQENFIIKKLNAINPEYGEAFRKTQILQKHGILGNTAMTGNAYNLIKEFDDPKAMNKAITGATDDLSKQQKMLKTMNPMEWADKNLAMYSRADERAKIAAFDWALTPKGQKKLRESGLYKAHLNDEEVAAAFVNKTWFNFSDVTPFEKDVLQNIIPFYTWARKNLSLQIDNILHNSRGTGRVIRTTKNWNKMVEQEENEMDMFAQQDGQLNISPLTNMLPGRDNDNVTTLNAQSTAVSAWDTASNPMQSLHPALKAVIQDSTGVDTFTGQPTEVGFAESLKDQLTSPVTSKIDMINNLRDPETKAMDDLNFTREFDRDVQRKRVKQTEQYRLQQLIQQKQQAGTHVPTISELLPTNSISSARMNRLRQSRFSSKRRTGYY